MNSNFCSLPWVGLDVSPQGNFKPCCKFEYPISDNLDGYLKSHELQQLKRDFENGLQPAGCRRCWEDESVGIASKRQMDFEHTFGGVMPDLSELKIVSMPFGNTCNLACRTCSSIASSRWYQETKKLQKEIAGIPIYTHKKFYKDREFMDRVAELSNNALLFEFPGGEPFLTGIDEHLHFLEGIANPNMKLHYTTNGTVMPQPEFWKLWKRFKHVNIQISIDGIGKHFEYNRWPAVWEECYHNIKQYQQHKTDNIQLSISHTVSIFTVMYLPEFLSWCDHEGLPSPYLGMVSNPAHYSIKALPETASKTIANMPAFQTELLKPISTSLLESGNNCFDKFVEYVKIIDKHRQQDFAETFPELYNLIKEEFNA